MNWKSLLLSGLLLLSFALLPVSSDPKADRIATAAFDEANVLKGLTGVSVIVEPIREDAEQDGLHKEDVQRDIELKLRLAGVKVLSRVDNFIAAGQPVLGIAIGTQKQGDLPSFGFTIQISVHENAILEHTPSPGQRLKVLGVITWQKTMTGVVGDIKLSELRNDVKDMVDIFLNDYLTANPKK